MVNKHELKVWLSTKREHGFINCDVDTGEKEYNFIMNMAEELLKRIEEEEND